MDAALRAVLFDFDGTLADSYPAIAASVNHVRALHGLPTLDVAAVRRHVGRGPNYLVQHTVPGGDVEADVDAYRAHHPSVMRSGTHLMPGASKSLHALHAADFLLGVCSNKPVAFTRDLLAYFGVDACFQVVLGPEDVARPKPAPDMLVQALKDLGVRPNEALYVGDMTVDVQTARAAGVRVWVVPTGSDDPGALARAEPDRILTDLDELRTLLLPPGAG
jgi:phosphoglycolate phosphatase